MPTATGRCTTWSLLRGWPAPVQRKCEIQWLENSKLWADWIDVSIIGKKSEDYWEIRRANDVSYEAGLKVWFEKGLCSQSDTLSTSIARPIHPWHPCIHALCAVRWGCVVKLPTLQVRADTEERKLVQLQRRSCNLEEHRLKLCRHQKALHKNHWKSLFI